MAVSGSVDRAFWNPDCKTKLSLSTLLRSLVSHEEQHATGAGEAQIQPSNTSLGEQHSKTNFQHNEKLGSDLLHSDLNSTHTSTSKYNWTYKFV